MSRYRFATSIHGDFLPETAATLDEAVLLCPKLAKANSSSFGAASVYCIDTLSVPHLVRGLSRGKGFLWMKDCAPCRGRGFTLDKAKKRSDCAKCRGDGRILESGGG